MDSDAGFDRLAFEEQVHALVPVPGAKEETIPLVVYKDSERIVVGLAVIKGGHITGYISNEAGEAIFRGAQPVRFVHLSWQPDELIQTVEFGPVLPVQVTPLDPDSQPKVDSFKIKFEGEDTPID